MNSMLRHDSARTKFAITLGFFSVLISLQALSQTVIPPGNVSGVWTIQNSPYIVQGLIAVDENKALVIKPGVVVKFDHNAKLYVGRGESLLAQGTTDSIIVFTSSAANPAPGDWGDIFAGIHLEETEDKVVLQYCLVEYATNGIACFARASGCSHYDNRSRIENSVARYNSGSGVYLKASASSLQGCLPSQSGVCSPPIRFNWIYENGADGIQIRAYEGYKGGGYIGAEIFKNVIANNKGSGIDCDGDDQADPDIINNTIFGNAVGGIQFRKNFYQQWFVIKNNIVARNGVGINSVDAVVPTYYGYNNVWNNGVNYQGLTAAVGDISNDPLFIDATNRDYHLQASSPCIDAGDSTSPKDPDSTRADIGAFYFRQFIPPKAKFAAIPTTGTAPLTVHFINQSTGDITGYLWNFGDGQTSAEANPSHLYSVAGNYAVTLNATGPGGSSTATGNISVVPPRPTANFTASPRSGRAPLTVQFTDQSSGQVTSREWFFGDGSPMSTQMNPSYTYQNPGVYSVLLQVTGPGGSDSKMQNNYITVTGTSFTDTGINLTPMRSGAAAWGDYDADGDLDILMTGRRDNNFYAMIYRNNGNGTFTNLNAALAPVAYGNASWGDYDHDGDLDILLAGWDNVKDLLYVYKNAGNGNFVKLSQELKATGYMDAEWGDMDNDGDLDIVVSGFENNTTPVVYLYANNKNDSFTFAPLSLTTPVYDGSVTVGDSDNDGDLDLLLTGRRESTVHTLLYRNDGNLRFSLSNATFRGVHSSGSSTRFGDYDNDGDLDIAIMGNDLVGNYYTTIYRNNGNNSFAELNAGLANQKDGNMAWGDYDNDGDLDLLVSGFDGSNDNVKFYRNDGNGRFTRVSDNLVEAIGACQWGDYNNDGDLDVLLIGWDGTANHFAKIYRNDNTPSNNKPTAPTNLRSSFVNGVLTVWWDAATDRETPAQGLTHNLRVGVSRGGQEVMAAHASNNGALTMPAFGNIQHNKTWVLRGLNPNLTYYWAVQAIDGCFAGSSWATAEVKTAVSDNLSDVPLQYSLQQNYPNPFNPETQISYTLPEISHVKIAVYNSNGQEIRALVDRRQNTGKYSVSWDGRRAEGDPVASGVYLLRMEADRFVAVRKIVLAR